MIGLTTSVGENLYRCKGFKGNDVELHIFRHFISLTKKITSDFIGGRVDGNEISNWNISI